MKLAEAARQIAQGARQNLNFRLHHNEMEKFNLFTQRFVLPNIEHLAIYETTNRYQPHIVFPNVRTLLLHKNTRGVNKYWGSNTLAFFPCLKHVGINGDFLDDESLEWVRDCNLHFTIDAKQVAQWRKLAGYDFDMWNKQGRVRVLPSKTFSGAITLYQDLQFWKDDSDLCVA